MKRTVILLPALAALAACTASFTPTAGAADFASSWPAFERSWLGPDFWANRLQDWKISGGRLVCTAHGPNLPMRTAHLLTRRLGENRGDFTMSITIGITGSADRLNPDAGAGFLLGAAPELDYRAAALVHHSPGPGGGIFAGIDGEGRLFIADFSDPVKAGGGQQRFAARDIVRQRAGMGAPHHVSLALSAKPSGGASTLTLTVSDPASGAEISSITARDIPSERLVGSMAIVSHGGFGDGDCSFWFHGWRMSGGGIEAREDRACGPILSTQYTLHRDILTMTAQLMPLAPEDTRTARLEANRGGGWETIARADVVDGSFTATFRIEGWDAGRDTPFRVAYDLVLPDGSTRTYTWGGTVRKNPVDKREIVVAGFTGNHNVRRGGVDRGTFDWNGEGLWFPHADLTEHVAAHDPDFLFFSGDNVYEGASPTRPDRERPWLDYLYKWYLWCWAFRDLAKDIPTVTVPDDHDVYHGNVWGAGGRHAESNDDGGYTMPADWVNMVQRTQTSNLPEPYDPTPVEQGITVYYTSIDYGGVSFAVLEDRKFKSSPTVMVPAGEIVNGWAQNPDFDPVTQADVPGAVLLGDRQLAFLEDWAADWTGGARFKAVLSQTVFSNVATLPTEAGSDAVVPGLERFTADDYPPDDEPVADADSNGWPQTGRNRALRAMRKGFAFHLSGDQHLGSTIHYGVDDWNDAGYALCVPSIANFFPRRWYPKEPGGNHRPGMPRYTGEYRDGFGNKITVLAVSNPIVTGRKPELLHDKAPGYGIVRFDKDARTVTIECWPRWADPRDPGAKQYPGWPIVTTQEDQYGRKAAAWLPTVRVTGMTDPVVQVIDEADGEIVYTLRIEGNSWRPKVFREGTYTVKVGEQGTARMKTFTGVRSVGDGSTGTIEAAF